jgi:predicted phage terminase large subunit-like protein
LIEQGRVRAIPPGGLTRIVVAIDPAVTSGEESDETGIIVAGLAKDGDAYVLADRSLQASPHGWASMAVGLYHQHKADRVLGEVNNGGDMIEATLRAVDPRIPYRALHASRGKVARAEPVAALYEQGRVHHVGAFPELEDQMCTYTAGSTDSPDRMDALVWALTDLIIDDEGGVLFIPIGR